MRIGIDVGGTNTDAVLMDGERVVAAVKRSTTRDVTGGIVAALEGLRDQLLHDRPGAGSVGTAGGTDTATLGDVNAVMIGTTHFINALVEADRLAPTAAVRLGLPATSALPPFVDWPDALVEAVSGRGYLCHGGHEFDGRLISELDPDELRRTADDIRARGIRSVAVSSVFSPVNIEFEERAAEILAAELPGVPISLSHEIGRIGLLERENATIVNAALRELATGIVDGLAGAMAGLGITAPLYLSQNDGTLMDLEFARRYPVATFASGPTNSMRGAAALSGIGTCAVVDIGGTTSDIGILSGGFPREATTEVTVAGIRTNFRMPDVLSIGLGGGSRIHPDHRVGPDSVGYRLPEQALVFGGSTLTATDIAVAAGRAEIGDPRWSPTWTGAWSRRSSSGSPTRWPRPWSGCGPARSRFPWWRWAADRSSCPTNCPAAAPCTVRATTRWPTPSARPSRRSAARWTGSTPLPPAAGRPYSTRPARRPWTGRSREARSRAASASWSSTRSRCPTSRGTPRGSG